MAQPQYQLPQWAQNMLLRNLQRAEDQMSQAYEPYRGKVPAYVKEQYWHRNAPPAELTKHEGEAQYLAGEKSSQMPDIAKSRQYLGQMSGFAQPGVYQQYMDPYQEAVVNRIKELGNQNLRENLLPALEAKFLRLGQHGGSRHAQLYKNTLRDVQSEISGRQAEALSHGYQQAAAIHQADMARKMEQAKHSLELSRMLQAGRLADIMAHREAGAFERELHERPHQLAAMEHRAAKEYPMQRAAQMASILYGVPEHMAPQNRPQSMHRRDWQNLGGSVLSNVLSHGMFGGGGRGGGMPFIPGVGNLFAHGGHVR